MTKRLCSDPRWFLFLFIMQVSVDPSDPDIERVSFRGEEEEEEWKLGPHSIFFQQKNPENVS